MRLGSRLVGASVLADLLAAACGSGSSGDTSTAQTVDQGVAQGVSAALGGSTISAPGAATTALPQTLEEWEALATQQRAATGTDGLTIDLSKCPAGWINFAGELEGGVTRTNLMVALRTMDMTNPMLLPEVKFNLSGDKDGYVIEGSDISATSRRGQVEGETSESSPARNA